MDNSELSGRIGKLEARVRLLARAVFWMSFLSLVLFGVVPYLFPGKAPGPGAGLTASLVDLLAMQRDAPGGTLMSDRLMLYRKEGSPIVIFSPVSVRVSSDRIHIHDRDGRERIRLSLGAGSPKVLLFDEHGRLLSRFAASTPDPL